MVSIIILLKNIYLIFKHHILSKDGILKILAALAAKSEIFKLRGAFSERTALREACHCKNRAKQRRRGAKPFCHLC